MCVLETCTEVTKGQYVRFVNRCTAILAPPCGVQLQVETHLFAEGILPPELPRAHSTSPPVEDIPVNQRCDKLPVEQLPSKPTHWPSPAIYMPSDSL